MDHITLYSSQVYLSEDNSNPDSYIAKFIICDFGRNKNGVALDRNSIDQWLSTLKNKPLVGKIKMCYDGTYDFTSHNMKKVKKVDEQGNEYYEVEFDTDAFGAFFDVGIEKINDIEYIVASCEIWKRFSKACEIIIKRIKEGTLHTSWEISVEQSSQGIVDGLMTKIIQVGRFIGHCLLAKDVSPAYDSSGLLEIASTNYDVEFAEALSQDIISQGLDIENKAKEENSLQKNIGTNVAEEESVVETPVADTAEQITESASSKTDKNVEVTETESNVNTPEVSALTERDLRRRIGAACDTKMGDSSWCYITFWFPEDKVVWCEYGGRKSQLDFMKFTYEVNGETVTVSDGEKVTLTVEPTKINEVVAEYEKTITKKDDLIVKASSEITSLKSENTELSQYKEKFTQMEQEKVAAELAQKKEDLIASVVKSGQITKEEIENSEELSGYVENLDKKSLMAIVGERLSASVDKKNGTEVEASETKNDVHVASNLNSEDEVVDGASIMRNFLRK